MILIVAFVNSSDNKIFAASDRKKCFISSNEGDNYEDRDDINLMIISVASVMKNLPSPPTTRVEPSRSFSRAQSEHW